MSKFSIKKVFARRIWDSRGRPTIEVDVILRYGTVGRGVAPSGASVGSGEALELRDGGTFLSGLDVRQAILTVNTEIDAALKGQDTREQIKIDTILCQLDGTNNKSRLGGNALIATSTAVLNAAAAAEKLPLWQYLSFFTDQNPKQTLPLPEIQIFGGGAHAAGRVEVQDFMVIAVGADSFGQALEWTAGVYHAAGNILADSGRLQGVADEGGFWPAFDSNEEAIDTLVQAIEKSKKTPGQDIAISLDIAASELGNKGQYTFSRDNQVIDTDTLCGILVDWIEKYPIVSIEDPLGEDDVEGLIRFTWAVGKRVQVVGDDFLVTNAERIAAAATQSACNAVLIKPNQAGTLSETKAALNAAEKGGYNSIISARSGETEDTTITHLGVGWGLKQLKVGSLARSERLAKWNEGLRIAEIMHKNDKSLPIDGNLPPRHGFPWK